jgi:amino acid adenylation domain-containing protein
VQVVRRGVELEVVEEDWRGKSEEEREAGMERYLEEDRERGFEVSVGPLMRLALMREADEHFSFVWSFHHLILDGWSVGSLIKEVFENYEGQIRGEGVEREGARPYRDYIHWLSQQDVVKAEAYWREQLRGVIAPTPLGIEPVLTAKAIQKGYGEQAIPLRAALRAFARQQRLTLNTVIQGAWALLLSRYSRESDVVFGAVVSGRPAALPDVESMIGLFINTLPVRVRIRDEQSVGEWLKQLQDSQMEMRQYEYSSLVQVQGWSEVPRGLPLFESILVFENFPAMDSSVKEQGKAFELSNVQTLEQTNYPLTILASSDAEASLTIRYDRNRFDDATIARILGHFETLLESIVADPGQTLARLPLLTPVEEQLLTTWNETQVDYLTQNSIHQLIEQQAALTPDSVALVFGTESLTYQQLNERANRLAHHLRSLGVGPESLVAILMERSFEMVISLLAILKAGGAYLPLDPTYPEQRLSFMLADAQPLVLLRQAAMSSLLSVPEAIAVIEVDQQAGAAAETAQYSSENPGVKIGADNLAYLIYTSGSTGTPKGVMVSHAAIANRLLWMQHHYLLNASDSILQKTPFTFDVSLWEFFWPLISGARLVLARPGGHQDARYLRDIINEQQITTLHFVPSMLQAFIAEEGLEAACQSLRRVICSGEALPAELVERTFERLSAEIENLYGPTEAAVDVTRWGCERGVREVSVPIGRPIANTEMYVLDERLMPVPVGVSGELYIGGVGLARGYRGRAELTAERFIPHPYSTEGGARLYRTGDIGKYREGGEIEYVGRADYQVKVRGYRIELGEIEAVLRQHEAVREAVVVIREDKPDDKQLVAYLVPHHGQEPVAVELRSYMKEKLPQYMLPQAFVMLEALPLSSNGKVARNRLPEPERAGVRGEEKTYAAPTNPTELRVLQIWEDLFDIRPIGIRDDFFDLGGHSILALRLMARLQKQFGQELPLATLLAEPTVEKLALILQQQQGGSSLWSPLVAIQQDGRKPAFFCVHPSGGNVLCYVELSHQLGAEQPFYGLQDPPSLDGSRQTYDNIEAMATHYNEVMREVQPEGPYYLGGYSFGGLVAFEMAQQLRRQNQEVALVALIDTAIPQNISRLLELEAQIGVDDGLMLALEVKEQARQAGIEVRISLADLWQLPPPERVGYAFERAKDAHLWPPEIGLAEVEHYLKLHKGRRQAIHTYEPQPFDGQLTLLRTNEPPEDTFAELAEVADRKLLQQLREEQDMSFRNPTLGWEKFTQTPVDVHLLEGDHHSILIRPHVKKLAERIQACLEKA